MQSTTAYLEKQVYSTPETDLTRLHKALMTFERRAERLDASTLAETFVNAEPLMDLLRTRDNQIIYGRRGTGKTHALKSLADLVSDEQNVTIYIDLRSIGSNGTIYKAEDKSLSERATHLLIDVLREIHDSWIRVAASKLDSDTLKNAPKISEASDRLRESISRLKVVGQTTNENTLEKHRGSKSSASGQLEFPLRVKANASVGIESGERQTVRTSEAGKLRYQLNFGGITESFIALAEASDFSRAWILIDEWSEVPIDLQPYLADLLRRTLFPISRITVKIAAIEHRTNFRSPTVKGGYIGIEVGAETSVDINLDDFMVFDNDQEKAKYFFKNLLFNHYKASTGSENYISSPDKMIQALFTQVNAFEEFVRAVEGIPRDALNIATVIAQKAFGKRISIQDVRVAARDWYQRDKARAVEESMELNGLLQKIIEEVIGHRRARAFLARANHRSQILDSLFDARLLHILKKSISSNDSPGIRYDAYKLDYGCYVDLINTTKAPQGLLPLEIDEQYVEVPPDDYRSIRRAILDVNAL